MAVHAMNTRWLMRCSPRPRSSVAAILLAVVPAFPSLAQAPELRMNVVYVCTDGRSFKVFSCKSPGPAAACDYQTYKNGQANQRGEGWRGDLSSLLPAKCHAQTAAEAQADPHRGEVPPRVAAAPNPNGASANLRAINAAANAQVAAAQPGAGGNPRAALTPPPIAPPLGNYPGTNSGARDAANAELARHWLKGPDGWTSAQAAGVPGAPDTFLRQYRDLTIENVEAQEIAEADRLNGIEWVGRATFKPTSGREAGGSLDFVFGGLGSGPQAYVQRQSGRWSQWIAFTPGPMLFERVKGAWQFRWDGSYLRGTLPGSQDFAAAGVK
jgi:hypothetical protein